MQVIISQFPVGRDFMVIIPLIINSFLSAYVIV